MSEGERKLTPCPKPVFDAIMRVRASGRTNMFDVNGVLRELNRLREPRAPEAYVWVEEHRELYFLGILNGFVDEATGKALTPEDEQEDHEDHEEE